MSKALQRPTYLTKPPDVKVWEVQIENYDGVSFNRFTNMQQAKKFAAKHSVPFYPENYTYVPQSKLASLRGLHK